MCIFNIKNCEAYKSTALSFPCERALGGPVQRQTALLNSRKCKFFSDAVSKMCTCWWKQRQIQFGQSHHHFSYQCTVSQRNSFRILKMFTSWKILQHMHLARRDTIATKGTHTLLSNQRDNIRHLCIHSTLRLHSLVYHFHTVQQNMLHIMYIETIRSYGCGSVWRTFEAIPAVLQVYTHEWKYKPFNHDYENRRRKCLCTVQKACQPLKHEDLALNKIVARCILRSGDARRGTHFFL